MQDALTLALSHRSSLPSQFGLQLAVAREIIAAVVEAVSSVVFGALS